MNVGSEDRFADPIEGMVDGCEDICDGCEDGLKVETGRGVVGG